MRKVCSASAALAGLGVLAACAPIDRVDERAIAMHESAARYADEAALFDLVRVIKGEPIRFASLDTVQGHDTESAGIGLPTFTLGWHAKTQPRTFSFGPNTANRSQATDFSLAVVDDPATYKALMTPLNPATFGFFQDQAYDSALLMHLFFFGLRYGRSGPGAGPAGPTRWESYWGEMRSGTFDFDQSLDELSKRRLTVQIDFTSPIPAAGAGLRGLRYRTCEQTQTGGWVCADSNPAGPATFETPRHVQAEAEAVADEAETLANANPPQFVWSIPSVVDNRGVDISLRSTLAVYKFVAEIARPDRASRPPWAAGVRITHDKDHCAIHIVYEREHWCVPEGSRDTLQIIDLLHQLLSINTSAQQRTESTPTVRVTGMARPM